MNEGGRHKESTSQCARWSALHLEFIVFFNPQKNLVPSA